MEFKSESLSQPEPVQPPDRPAGPEEALLRFLLGRDKAELEAMLRCVQLRLGTPSERFDDMEAAQAVAHQLNNLRTYEVLGEELKKFEPA